MKENLDEQLRSSSNLRTSFHCLLGFIVPVEK